MADRAFMYCPLCRDNGSPRVELMRDMNLFTCLMGHSIVGERLQMLKPEMIRTEVIWKPGTGDVKTEVWVNQEVLMKAKEVLGNRFHPTIASIIRSCMAGEPIIIDGVQAEELKKLGIRNGAEMVATAKQNKELVGMNEDLTTQVIRWETRIAGALANQE